MAYMFDDAGMQHCFGQSQPFFGTFINGQFAVDDGMGFDAGVYGPPCYSTDELRTIFLTGFPLDVKERELSLLCRFLPGYEASQLNFKHGQAQGFVLFVNGAAAWAALGLLNNLVFDEDSQLRAEMARKNMYIRDFYVPKRGRYTQAPGPYGNPSSHDCNPPPQGFFPPSPGPGSARFSSPGPVAGSSQRPYSQDNKDNPPCNTLFIGNLGDAVQEGELLQLFGPAPGFRQLKLSQGAKSFTCFVEFSDIPSAMAVHQAQQGAILQSSDKGGIRIQYSKNPYGRPRDSYTGSSSNNNGAVSTPPRVEERGPQRSPVREGVKPRPAQEVKPPPVTSAALPAHAKTKPASAAGTKEPSSEVQRGAGEAAGSKGMESATNGTAQLTLNA